MRSVQKMRIIVASEDRSACAAIGMLIGAQADLESTCEVHDIPELLVKIKAHQPELVVLDWEMLGQRIETLVDLLELFAEPPAIVALSVHEETRNVALDLGINGFAFKGDPPSQLLEIIRSALRKNVKGPSHKGIGR